jgi:hypothetical protein
MVISGIVLLLLLCDNMPWLFTLLQITDCHKPSFVEVSNWLNSDQAILLMVNGQKLQKVDVPSQNSRILRGFWCFLMSSSS